MSIYKLPRSSHAIIAAEDTYDEKRDQAVPPPIATDRPTSSRPLEKSLATERRRKETEVVVNLGGSFIAAGSLADPKTPRGLPMVEEENQRGSGSIDVNLTIDRGKERLGTVPESIAPSTTAHSHGATNTGTGTGTAVTGGTDGEESYMAKKMAHIMTNERAFKVLNRIEQKLAGTDSQLWGERVGVVGSGPEGQAQSKAIDVEEQVQYLIEEATKHENLAQGGWSTASKLRISPLTVSCSFSRISARMASYLVKLRSGSFST